MWKPSSQSTPSRVVEPERIALPSIPAAAIEAAMRPPGALEQATIGKTLMIKGEISGAESLLIEGRVDGSVSLPGNRVTIGRSGIVAANIQAREIVVQGKVHGNLDASDRVEIRAEGSLVGDITAARISVEDGAFVKGGIDLRKPQKEVVQETKASDWPFDRGNERNGDRPLHGASAISYRA